MSDLFNFEGAECEGSEADVRAMCDDLKFAAPPSQYSLEDAVEMVVRGHVSLAEARRASGVPAFIGVIREFGQTLSAVFSAQRLSNAASSLVVLVMLMIIPLALFSNSGMAMNTVNAQTRNWQEGVSANDDYWKLECSKYMCGDTRYEK